MNDEQLIRMKQRDMAIVAAWDKFDVDGISTERLLQMVMDETGCEIDRVLRGLEREGIIKRKN